MTLFRADPRRDPQEVKRVDLEQMEWMSERINELDRRNDEQDRHRRKALADVYTLTADRDDLARRLGEATAALLALRKWIDEYSNLVERSKRWVHDSTMWETSSYPELAKEWQALWNRYPESVIDINTHPTGRQDREVRAALKSAGGASRTERGDRAKAGK